MADRLSELQAWDGNPRTISEDALRGLALSLATFGDLGGIVYNESTGHLVCGHQRRAALADADLSVIRWSKPFTVQLGFPAARFDSLEEEGEFRAAGGARFRVRRVRWPADFEAAANVSANNPHLQGEYDWDSLQPLLDGLADLPGLDAAALRLDALAEELLRAGLEAAGDSAELAGPPSLVKIDTAPKTPIKMCWALIGIPADRMQEYHSALKTFEAIPGGFYDQTIR